MLGRLFTGPFRLWLSVLAGLMLFGAAGVAEACCTPPPPACCQPPPPPPPPPPSGCNCGGHSVVVPGVNVSVQSTAIAIAGASASARGGAGGEVIVGGGGGGSWGQEQGYPSVVPLLHVEAEAEARAITRRVAYQATRKSSKRVVIQAVCIDDRSVPHPASQVRPEREVEAFYEGEIYRCIAGTRLQVLFAEYRGEISFEGGRTIDCRKGDALWHEHGLVTCRPQKPARDCNERSLLRRFGAGVKILTMIREETYTAYRDEVVTETATAKASASAGAIVLDGGVGGIVR